MTMPHDFDFNFNWDYDAGRATMMDQRRKAQRCVGTPKPESTETMALAKTIPSNCPRR